MVNVTFGFVVFERCSHCLNVRTYFSVDEASDAYREGECRYATVEHAQSLRFDLRCRKCEVIEPFSDLMGLMYCTECLEGCEVMRIQQELLRKRAWPIVAFGHLPEAKAKPFPPGKLEALTDYFNQRRDVSRSRVEVVPFHLIKDISMCKGEFIHDVGVLSSEPEPVRKHLL
jgi:hypothetical protein